MPEHLHLPTDFERLPEYRLLVGALRQHHRPAGIPFPLEAIASHLWLRLWVELAYQARVTNRPGWLAHGRALFVESVGGLFGEDCPVLALLEAATVLEARAAGADTDYFCPLFERFNAHTAGNHVSREKRGQLRSAHVRQDKELTLNTLATLPLLPPEIYKKADGTPMAQGDPVVKKAVLLVNRLDRALTKPVRNPGGFTQGLMADAYAVAEKHADERLREFCFWLLEAREHPATPQTAEQILGRWDDMLVMAGLAKPAGVLL